jgi:hypothetical protein
MFTDISLFIVHASIEPRMTHGDIESFGFRILLDRFLAGIRPTNIVVIKACG